MIITTSFNPDKCLIQRVNKFILSLSCIYVDRDKKSLSQILEDYDTNELIVLEKIYAKYYKADCMETPFFFHPSMSTLRINRLKKGENDILIQLSGLKAGDSFLDCTLGLASDAIVASYIVGVEGKVVGLESEKILAAIVDDGLHNNIYKDNDLNIAMKRIEVINDNHINKLKSYADNSFDIVFFDPMFRYRVNKSIAINPLRFIANHEALLKNTILEAKRVAKRRVILKESSSSTEFERLGFDEIIRSSSTTYGIILNGDR